MTHSKSIFVSYAREDEPIARRLKGVLESVFGDDVWLRDFDLDAGDPLLSCIEEAASEAKWFIIVLSKAAISTKWVKMEVDLATLRALETEEVNIIILRLDSTELPNYLKVALLDQPVFDLVNETNLEDRLLDVAEAVRKGGFSRRYEEVYIDRGGDADKFSLRARRNRIVFIHGFAGIGKSAFVRNSVSRVLKKVPCTIELTRGHSADLLSRQIMQKAHVAQPINGEEFSDAIWLSKALDALSRRADRFFLFIDRAEEGIDASSQLFSFLGDFLSLFSVSTVETHVILATTRAPDYPPAIAATTDLFQLYGLGKEYIRECIDVWLEGQPERPQLMESSDMNELVRLAGGHPLAARMISTHLKSKSPQQILHQKIGIQLKIADYIIRSSSHLLLSKLHKLILHILCVVGQPMSIEDLMSVKSLSSYSLEEVHSARWDLSNWALIEQKLEMISLHDFISAYFLDDASREQGRVETIARQYGHRAFDKSMELNRKLSEIRIEDPSWFDEDANVQLSNEVFRYAVPAQRLLLSVGEDELVEQLPIQVKGTLRELVFHFYQDRKLYHKALYYAEQWLKICPSDTEIKLFQARCYRNLKDAESLNKASDILTQIAQEDIKKRFEPRLYRERGLIAQYVGDLETAKKMFRKGIDVNRGYPYTENAVGLARTLLMEIDGLSISSSEKQKQAAQAVEVLEKAREQSDTFDRFHLALYVEALLRAGHADRSISLMLQALDEEEDEHLNHKLAEVFNGRGQYREAELHARRAMEGGVSEARLTLANALYGLSIGQTDSGNGARDQLSEALDLLLCFVPKDGHDQQIVDTTASKIYRSLHDLPRARNCIDKYENPDNVEVMFEQCRIALDEGNQAAYNNRPIEAIDVATGVSNRISEWLSTREGPELKELLTEANALKTICEDQLDYTIPGWRSR